MLLYLLCPRHSLLSPNIHLKTAKTWKAVEGCGSTYQKLMVLIPDSSNLHVKVSLGMNGV